MPVIYDWHTSLLYANNKSNIEKLQMLRAMRRAAVIYRVDVTHGEEIIFAARRWIDRKEHQQTQIRRSQRVKIENYLVALWNIIHKR